MAILEIATEPPPLRVDGTGTARVGQTRVTLDTVLGVYLDGATSEEIVLNYNTLTLADVHGAISYYWRHQAEVEAYLAQRRQEAGRLREQIEAHSPTQELRARLLARRNRSA